MVQNPVILNPLLLKDKHYRQRDIFARLELQTECVSFIPDISPLLQNLNGASGGGKQHQWTIYNSMLCQPPAKRVYIDYEKPATHVRGEYNQNIYGNGGVRRVESEKGVTLRQLLEAHQDVTAHGLSVFDIRIPGVFFVTEQEWDWVHGKCKYPGPAPEVPPPPPRSKESILEALEDDVWNNEKLSARILSFLDPIQITQLQSEHETFYKAIRRAEDPDLRRALFLDSEPAARQQKKTVYPSEASALDYAAASLDFDWDVHAALLPDKRPLHDEEELLDTASESQFPLSGGHAFKIDANGRVIPGNHASANDATGFSAARLKRKEDSERLQGKVSSSTIDRGYHQMQLTGEKLRRSIEYFLLNLVRFPNAPDTATEMTSKIESVKMRMRKRRVEAATAKAFAQEPWTPLEDGTPRSYRRPRMNGYRVKLRSIGAEGETEEKTLVEHDQIQGATADEHGNRDKDVDEAVEDDGMESTDDEDDEEDDEDDEDGEL